MKQKSLNQEERALLHTLAGFMLGGALSSVYVNVFIWKQVESFAVVVGYNVVVFTALVLMMILSGYWLRSYSARTLVKLGLLLVVVFYLGLMLLGESAVDWLVVLGLFSGTGTGLFWAGYNLHQYVESNREGREYYFGLQQSVYQTATVLGPLVGGVVIWLMNWWFASEYIGYLVVFGLSAVCFLYALAYVWEFARLSAVSYSLAVVKQRLLQSGPFRLILGQQALTGFYDVSVHTIMGIIGFVLLGSELALGGYRFSVGLLGVIMGYVGARYGTHGNQVKMALVGSVGLMVGTMLFGLWPTLGGLVLYGVGAGLGALIWVVTSAQYFGVLDLDKSKWQEKYEYLIARDIALGVARVMSYLLLWGLFSLYESELVYRGWLMLVAFSPLVVWALVRRVHAGLQG